MILSLQTSFRDSQCLWTANVLHLSRRAGCAAQELEEGIAALSADLKRARKDLEASRADNLALVERLKYVQGYQSAAGKARKGGFYISITSFLAITSFFTVASNCCMSRGRC